MNAMNKLISMTLCGVLLLSLAGCGGTEEAELMDTTVVVETASAESGALSSESSYIGTISADGTASVILLVSGTVEELAVSVGDEVSAGDFLCRIDDESAQLSLASAQASYQTALAAVASAQASVGSTEAAVTSAQESYNSTAAQYGADENGSLTILEDQVKLAQDNYENTQALFEIGAASQLEVDQARTSYASAQASLEAAQAGLSAAAAGVQQAQAGLESVNAAIEQAQSSAAAAQVGIASAEYQLTLYNLTAPISGVVEAVNVTKDNFASSGTAAFVISNGDNKTVTFYVTDAVRQTLTQGQAVTVTHSSKTYEGVVTEIGGVVNSSTGLFQIKAVIEEAQDLADGLSVGLSTVAYKADRAILIPSDALYFDNGAAYVYVVEDETAVRRDVTIGLYTTDTIAVTDGLEEGEEVITSWSATLTENAPIRRAGTEEAE